METHHIDREYDAIPPEIEPEFQLGIAVRNAPVVCEFLNGLDLRFFREACQARDLLCPMLSRLK
jgi:hypothetical protein